ncbi:uncharacterized protein LOC114828540 [Galendromus occidentalis]|uniref:Uncharacterized protein LOC114828540 n=1 Tax=Galendromus occidentalis TaxID=34638 RepID=A0AAJ7SI33_9ACAR|nr:uncharacterized protein LOC114828540 [Galendromus occidentalis]
MLRENPALERASGPANSAQFIIDDHSESCVGVFETFETPPIQSGAPDSSVNCDSDDFADTFDHFRMTAVHNKDSEERYPDPRSTELVHLQRRLLPLQVENRELKARNRSLGRSLSEHGPSYMDIECKYDGRVNWSVSAA